MAIAAAQEKIKQAVRDLAPHARLCGDPTCAVVPLTGIPRRGSNRGRAARAEPRVLRSRPTVDRRRVLSRASCVRAPPWTGGASGVNVYALATLMTRKGWGVFTGQKPPTLSIPVARRTPARTARLREGSPRSR